MSYAKIAGKIKNTVAESKQNLNNIKQITH